MKYALVNGVILDGTRDMQPKTGMAVLVDGEIIKDIVPVGDVPSDYRKVNLGGEYLMPGLINMHVHLAGSGKPQKKQRDNEKLLGTLHHLRDLGNTLIVVEHDEDTMRAADYIVDIGPGAGVHGGELIARGQEGINGLTLSNAMHLSSWLKQPVELPLDEDLFLSELNKKRKNSKKKKTSSGVTFDTTGTYGS